MSSEWICPKCGEKNYTADGDSCKCGHIVTKEEFRGIDGGGYDTSKSNGEVKAQS